MVMLMRGPHAAFKPLRRWHWSTWAIIFFVFLGWDALGRTGCPVNHMSDGSRSHIGWPLSVYDWFPGRFADPPAHATLIRMLLDLSNTSALLVMAVATAWVMKELRRRLAGPKQWRLSTLFAIVAVAAAVFSLFRVESFFFWLPSSLLPGRVKVALRFPPTAFFTPFLWPVVAAMGCTIWSTIALILGGMRNLQHASEAP